MAWQLRGPVAVDAHLGVRTSRKAILAVMEFTKIRNRDTRLTFSAPTA
jgi:hypothetical protein